ncbi:MAG: hypothetical protein PGN11_14915 [Quadrisphaera sp.]
MAGSTSPLRVPIAAPASGVRPMVVSTLRPPCTAVTETPLPTWATTRSAPSTGTPRKFAARLVTTCTLVPWKPYLRRPYRRATSASTAYVAARAGMVAWKAVSNTATCGTSGSARLRAEMAASCGGLCSGARAESSSMPRSTSSSTTVGSVYRVPPCTTRWPTPARPSSPGPPRSAASASMTCDSAAAWSGTSSEPMRSTRPLASTSARPGPCSRSWYFRLEEPALTTRTLLMRASAPWTGTGRR